MLLNMHITYTFTCIWATNEKKIIQSQQVTVAKCCNIDSVSLIASGIFGCICLPIIIFTAFLPIIISINANSRS